MQPPDGSPSLFIVIRIADLVEIERWLFHCRGVLGAVQHPRKPFQAWDRRRVELRGQGHGDLFPCGGHQASASLIALPNSLFGIPRRLKSSRLDRMKERSGNLNALTLTWKAATGFPKRWFMVLVCAAETIPYSWSFPYHAFGRTNT